MTVAQPAPISDQQARAEALDPARSFLVDAPAGSGKTELLIQRYLRLLSLVEQPEAIVAITFTRKAASEMRRRIVEALREAGTEPGPESAHKALTWDLARAVLERSRESEWELRDHPARLHIQTIDALCSAVTRQRPGLSGFGAQPQMAENAEDLYRQAARNTCQRLEDEGPASNAVECLLRHLDNRLFTLEVLLAEMLARRDQWLRHVSRSAGEQAQREQLERALCTVICQGLEKAARLVPAGPGLEIAYLARLAAQSLAEAGNESPILACLQLHDLPGCAVEDLPGWLGVAALLLTQEGEWRKTVNVNTGFPAEQKRQKQRCLALLGNLEEDHEEFREALDALRQLPAARFDEQQWKNMEALFTLLPVAVEELRRVFKEHGTVDFIEVAQGALAALGGGAAATDSPIRHLLVDEFQDTSFSQYQLLEKLTAGWKPGDGRTLFVVGDPKQSIYRFREAEVGLFLLAGERGIGSVPLEPLRLTANFRSQQGLVDWVNTSFAQVLPTAADIATGAVPHGESVARQAPGEGAAVTVHPSLVRNEEEEANQVVSLIERAQGKVAILVRARTHLPAILRHLREAQIRYRAVEIDTLSERPVIQDLMALTLALLNQGDRAAWLAILRAPWCGLTLADLHALAAEEHQSPLEELMSDPIRRQKLSPDGQARLDRLRMLLERCLAASGRAPLRRWVEGAWIALGGPACVGTEPGWADTQRFFDLLDEIEQAAEVVDRARLEKEVSGLFAGPGVGEGEELQVMTIHKAKGLEFDTVIVPGLGRTPPHAKPGLLRWLEFRSNGEETQLLLAPVKETGVEEDPIGRYSKYINEKKEDHEAGRLLYVAATRAKKRLHLLGHIKNGKPFAHSLLAKLWPAVEAEFRKLQEQVSPAPTPAAEEKPAPAPSRAIRRLPSGWTLPVPPEPASWLGAGEQAAEPLAGEQTHSFEWVGETLRHVGVVVHRLLRRIGEEGASRWNVAAVRAHRDLYSAALAGLGVPPEEMPSTVEKVEEALIRTLADPRGRWILAEAHAERQCEYALTGVLDGQLVRGIIDRTFLAEDGTRWIVDYKTGTHAGGDLGGFLDQERERYAAQLERYATLFSGLESRPVRLGLYFPLLGGWREWSPAPGHGFSAGAGSQ